MPLPTEALWRRTEWTKQVLQWIFSTQSLTTEEKFTESGRAQVVRMKWFIHLLNRNPELRGKVAAVMQSLVNDTRAVALWTTAGLHRHPGLLSELWDRVERKILPDPIDDQDVSCLVTAAFRNSSDAIAVAQLDLKQVDVLVSLFKGASLVWMRDLEESVRQLGVQIAAMGTHPELKMRTGQVSLSENPFYILHQLIEAQDQPRDFEAVGRQVRDCRTTLELALEYMSESGVSVNMVYHIDRIRAQLERLEILVDVLVAESISDSGPLRLLRYQKLAAQLIRDSVRSRRLRPLLNENLSLLAQKIVENSAETGEHYIARTGSELKHLFVSALGGGAVTAGTTLLKIGISALWLSPFLSALVSSLNYMASFIFIQAKGFGLATKQPAMTAARLADAIVVEGNEWTEEDESAQPEVSENLPTEIRSLLKSQLTAIAGNLLAVIPVAAAVALAYQMIFDGAALLSSAKANSTLESLAVIGPTPVYAIYTGVLLFLSSLFAGWFYHWVLYRRLPSALARSPIVVQNYGRERALKSAVWLKSHVASLAANVSLGLLLGLSPAVLEFLGIPLEVRHVTLSAGSLTYAAVALGWDVFNQVEFWLAVIGIFAIGLLNLAVSFSLALIVAFKAKRLPLVRILLLLKSRSARSRPIETK